MVLCKFEYSHVINYANDDEENNDDDCNDNNEDDEDVDDDDYDFWKNKNKCLVSY